MAEVTLISQIRQCIEHALDQGEHNIIIFPYGDIGMQVKNILKDSYNLEPSYIIDNHLCHYNAQIKPLSFLTSLSNIHDYCIILASTNSKIYNNLRSLLINIIPEEKIRVYEFFQPILPPKDNSSTRTNYFKTKIGKYSYGPIAKNHELIESIGNFCSFATGVEVVPNHPMSYITTHPMIYGGQLCDSVQLEYEDYKEYPWFFKGVHPHPHTNSNKRSIIGNDVWLGHNVIITNGSNIGNGVIAGAGAVITKDVPDYAIVVGVPARIVKYRYTPKQIEALNSIQWWNWSDAEIRERYDDFYLPIEDFIQKYL